MSARTDLFQVIFKNATSDDVDTVKKIRQLVSNEECGLFTVAQAAYYYAVHNHMGMFSELYEWTELLGYRPSPTESYDDLILEDCSYLEYVYQLIGEINPA